MQIFDIIVFVYIFLGGHYLGGHYMNKVYKVIFNHTLQVYQVVSELAKGHSKSKTPDIVRERHAG